MSDKISGNIKGLSPLEIKNLNKLFWRKVAKDQIISLDLARELYTISEQIQRKVGIILSREGEVTEVFVGTKEILYLPDLGRYRLGQARLRRLRLIYPDFSPKDGIVIPNDIYGDLEKLRLDMVVGIKPKKNRMQLCFAHIIPQKKLQTEDQVQTISTAQEFVEDLALYDFDFDAFMLELEAELKKSDQRTFKVGKTPAILVGVYEMGAARAKSSMDELEQLAKTDGVEVVEKIIQRKKPDPKTLVGKGKLEEIVLSSIRLGAELIIFDGELKPGQWRAITNSTELKVIDRSMLILDIFAQRAQSSEGRLQVELAQLQYNLPRLVEKDSGLSRLSGGIGGRGPGETKLEIGRRNIRDRIVALEKKIDHLGVQRELRRKRHRDSDIPMVSILGYTNVGKSTLFNALTRSQVVSEDKLFATLDPAKRKLRFPYEDWERTIILADTVGFIRDLPEELKNAFRATLEEIYEADLLIHVLDVSDPQIQIRKQAVDQIISQMELEDIPQIIVLNKADLVSAQVAESLQIEYDAILVSAATKSGFNLLLDEIKTRVFANNSQQILPKKSVKALAS